MKVIVGYLDKSMSKVIKYEEFIENKCKGDDAFMKNDYETAYGRYFAICCAYSTEALHFLMNQAKRAEEKKKWWICYDLSNSLTCLIRSFCAISSKAEEAFKVSNTEAWALKGKALRRKHNLDKGFDKMFLEKLAKCNVKVGNDVINPDEEPYSQFKSCKMPLEMADFSGNGKVTVKEFKLFLLCYASSLGILESTVSKAVTGSEVVSN